MDLILCQYCDMPDDGHHECRYVQLGIASPAVSAFRPKEGPASTAGADTVQKPTGVLAYRTE